jgi:hypothetical protein
MVPKVLLDIKVLPVRLFTENKDQQVQLDHKGSLVLPVKLAPQLLETQVHVVSQALKVNPVNQEMMAEMETQVLQEQTSTVILDQKVTQANQVPPGVLVPMDQMDDLVQQEREVLALMVALVNQDHLVLQDHQENLEWEGKLVLLDHKDPQETMGLKALRVYLVQQDLMAALDRRVKNHTILIQADQVLLVLLVLLVLSDLVLQDLLALKDAHTPLIWERRKPLMANTRTDIDLAE